jgi:hypothetical protein
MEARRKEMLPTDRQQDTLAAMVMRAAVGLALVATAAYLLIGLNFLGVGDLQKADAPAAITFLAAACYALGGLLILLHRRWLWVAGAAINALVMLVFFSAYAGRPSVMLSPGGLATKAAQLLLEVALLYLILTAARHPQRAAKPASP